MKFIFECPLVSQKKVLATREEQLREALRNKLEEVYKGIFLVGVKDVAHLFCQEITK